MGRAHQRVAELFVYEARDAWMYQASCVGKEDIFFPGRGRGGGVEKAIAICESCAVRPECEAYAERHETEYGVWGGKLYQPHGGTNAVSKDD